MAKKMSNLPGDNSPGPIDPNKGDLLKVSTASEGIGAAKDVQEAYGNPEKALELMVYNESTWLLKDPKIAESKDDILYLCLDAIGKIREYNSIHDFVLIDGYPSQQPEFKKNIESIAKCSGIEGKLLYELMSPYISNTELEFRYIDIAVAILRKEMDYDGIFRIAEECAQEAQRRGISAAPSYLRKAADILSENKELRSNPSYSSLVYEMEVFAEKIRYTGLQPLK